MCTRNAPSGLEDSATSPAEAREEEQYSRLAGRADYPHPPMPTGNPPQPVTAPRRTLAGTAPHIDGIGLFTGAPARVTLHPISVAGIGGSGIAFRRTDLGGMPLVRATIDNVVSEQR